MNLIPGLLALLLFQGAGELFSLLIGKRLPGPVLGMALLLAFLAVRGHIPTDIGAVADGFARHLGLLFVPAAVGVVMFLPQLKAYGWHLLLTLGVSVIATIAVTALVLKVLRPTREGEEP
jgi:holin-like protein